MTLVKLRLKFGCSQSLPGQFGFGLTETEYLQMTLRLPLKEAEYSASAPVSAELFGFICSLSDGIRKKVRVEKGWNDLKNQSSQKKQSEHNFCFIQTFSIATKIFEFLYFQRKIDRNIHFGSFEPFSIQTFFLDPLKLS